MGFTRSEISTTFSAEYARDRPDGPAYYDATSLDLPVAFIALLPYERRPPRGLRPHTRLRRREIAPHRATDVRWRALEFHGAEIEWAFYTAALYLSRDAFAYGVNGPFYLLVM